MPSAFPSWILVTCFVLNSWIWVSLGQGVSYKKASVWVVPSNVIIKGGNFTIRCRGPLAGVLFVLYRGNELTQTLRPTGNEAEFHFTNVQQRDTGTYICRYNPTSDRSVYSDASDPIDIQVRDTFPKPSLQVSPGTMLVRGGTLTFRCAGEHPDMRFTLRMRGTDLQKEEPRGNEAVFTISDVEQKHGGSYDCIYQTKSTPTVYSYPSDSILIRVRGTFSKPSLQVSPGTVAVRGGTLTFRCAGEHPDMKFTLRMRGTHLQKEEPRGNEAVFTISDVQQKDEGSYDCIYQTKSGPTVYSDPSGAILIQVKDNDMTKTTGSTKASSDDDDENDDDNTTNPPETSPTSDNGSIIISVVCAVLLLIGLIATAVLYTRCRQKKTKGDIQTKGLCSIEERAAPAPETMYATVQKRKTPYAADVPEVRESDLTEDQEGLTYVTINQEALKKKRPAQPRSEQDNTVYAAVNLH